MTASSSTTVPSGISAANPGVAAAPSAGAATGAAVPAGATHVLGSGPAAGEASCAITAAPPESPSVPASATVVVNRAIGREIGNCMNPDPFILASCRDPRARDDDLWALNDPPALCHGCLEW